MYTRLKRTTYVSVALATFLILYIGHLFFGDVPVEPPTPEEQVRATAPPDIRIGENVSPPTKRTRVPYDPNFIGKSYCESLGRGVKSTGHTNCFTLGAGYDNMEVCLEDFLPTVAPCICSMKGKVKCWPHLSNIGVAKSGTTTLWELFLRHEDAMFLDKKEPHYWGRHMWEYGPGPYSSFEKYTSLYKKLAQRVKVGINNKVMADFSAGTLWYNASTAEVYAPAVPDARQSVVLRNPTDRVYSDFKYFNFRGEERGEVEDYSRVPALFDKLVKQKIALYNACFGGDHAAYRHTSLEYLESYELGGVVDERFKRWKCAYRHDFDYLNPEPDGVYVRMSVSLYVYHLYVWLHSFEPDQLLVIDSYAMKTHEDYVLERLLTHYGLESDGDYYGRHEEANADSKPIPPMFEETRKLLDEFYAPHSRLLMDFIDERCLKVRVKQALALCGVSV